MVKNQFWDDWTSIFGFLGQWKELYYLLKVGYYSKLGSSFIWCFFIITPHFTSLPSKKVIVAVSNACSQPLWASMPASTLTVHVHPIYEYELQRLSRSSFWVASGVLERYFWRVASWDINFWRPASCRPLNPTPQFFIMQIWTIKRNGEE